MKTRTVAVTVAILLGLVAIGHAADSPFMGTWKLNDAKSSVPAGAPKNTTVTYAAAGDMVKLTTDGVDGAGKPTHSEWTGKFDGKPYPVNGMGPGMTRTVTAKGDRTLEVENLKDGKGAGKGKTEVSKDGKTRTLEIEGVAADGKKYKGKFVYDKQ